jgi:hypothetical protein
VLARPPDGKILRHQESTRLSGMFVLRGASRGDFKAALYDISSHIPESQDSTRFYFTDLFVCYIETRFT